jgi:putative methyltransferase (TIGR04325 family)
MIEHDNLKFIWHGKYSTFDDAETNVKRKNSNLNTSHHAGNKERIWYEKQKLFFDEAKNGKMLRNSNLQNIVENSQFSSVFDFGGGSGWQCALLRSRMHKNEITYFNIELRSTLDLFHAQSSTLTDYFEVDTFSNFPEPDFHSLFYSNSVIQYFSDNNHIINWIDNIRPKVVVIEDFMGVSGQEFYSAQNYYGYFMVNRFPSKSQFILDMKNKGYDIVNEYVYQSIINSKMNAKILLGNGLTEIIPESMTLIFERRASE